MRPRDSQRSKVYSLTTGAAGHKALTLEECEALIIKAHTRYGLNWTGRIKDGRGTRAARGGMFNISLPVWARMPETVLHETAHAIVDRRFGRDVAAHGPEFARILLELWAWAKLGSMPDLRTQARKRGVKVANEAACRPPSATAAKALETARMRLVLAKAELEAAKAELGRLLDANRVTSSR